MDNKHPIIEDLAQAFANYPRDGKQCSWCGSNKVTQKDFKEPEDNDY